jgi:hypothetical protein
VTIEQNQFVALVRDFPVSVDDADARMLAYIIWSTKVEEAGATPISSEPELDIREMDMMLDFPGKSPGEIVVRIVGLANPAD